MLTPPLHERKAPPTDDFLTTVLAWTDCFLLFYDFCCCFAAAFFVLQWQCARGWKSLHCCDRKSRLFCCRIFCFAVTVRQGVEKPPLLRSEIPSGMCAELRTVAASNNRDRPTRSLYYCLFVPHILLWVLFFAHIPFVVNRTFNATPAQRLQHHYLHQANALWGFLHHTWRLLHHISQDLWSGWLLQKMEKLLLLALQYELLHSNNCLLGRGRVVGTCGRVSC